MSLIDNYINITITRGNIGTNFASRNTLLIIGNTKKAIAVNTLPRVKAYGNLTEVVADYNIADPEYKAAALYFGQEVKPTKLLIGRVIGDQVADTFAAAYPKITLENNDFYGVMITSKVEVDQLAISALVEAENKIFGLSDEDQIMLDGNNVNSIAYKTRNLNRLRTFVLYHSLAADTYPEAAWFGVMFTKDAGSATWGYKSLSGVPTDRFNTAGATALQTNNANFYTMFGSNVAVLDGKTASGEYIDTVQGSDWLMANIQQKVAFAFSNTNKITYDNKGICSIECMLTAALLEASTKKIIDRDSIKVNSPNLLDIPIEDRANRKLSISFEARFIGAIQRLEAKGTLTV